MKMNDYVRRWDNSIRRWIYEHREVMENSIGRKLHSHEHIHHKDGNPKNNDLQNLEIVSASEHAIIHKPALKTEAQLKCMFNNCDNKRHAKGLCNKHYMKYLRNNKQSPPC